MNARLLRILHFSAGMLCLPGLAHAQAEGLKHDPFARPALAARQASTAAAPANAVKGPAPEPEWKPELAAVMVAGPKSVVSIDGRLVRIGEEIDGHRLVEVREQTAVFVKNRKKVTLTLRGLQLVPEAPPKQGVPSKQDDRRTAERRDATKPEEK